MALIALGVTGGIGAYKAVEIARGLQKNGHEVVAVMTRAARKFVGPLTFEAITRRQVITDQWQPGANADIEHIAIASNIDLLVVAPATANTIAKFANGLADDFLSSLYTATRAPVLLAPAMNTNMFDHPAVAKNLETLMARGVHFVGNRSSGRMGYAVASEALRRGAAVTLVTGPTHLTPPHGAELVKVRSAAEMHAAVIERAPGRDVVIMAAAVADYTPAEPSPQKVKKSDGPVTITLERTKDILGDLGKLPSRTQQRLPVLVGFAAETKDVISYAQAKLKNKGADLIV